MLEIGALMAVSRLARKLGLAGGAVLCILAAAPGRADTGAADRALHQAAVTLFASSYRQIQEFYLDPVSLRTLAVAGIAGLDAPDRSFMIGTSDSDVTMVEGDREIARISTPRPDDADGWAEVTASAIVAARNHSRELAQATDESLYQRVFDGITAKLDRFTRYAGRDQARDQRAARDGFGGIGVSLDLTEPMPRISSVVPDGPSARAGIRVDDRLIQIDDTPITRLNQDEVMSHLRGALNTRVSVIVRRPGADKPIGFALVRSLIVQPTVTADRDDGIAIFHVDGFNVATATDLGQEIHKARIEMGTALKGAVLDLRGNPGGLLDQAAAVASLFLDHGDIVSTRGRHPTATQYFSATAEDRLRGIPLVVLVNGGTASSSEIVAAALQDNGRAVIAGSSTYGKGTVQMVVRLENNGELTLTWARLIAPTGYILHGHGIVPTFCTDRPVDPVAAPEDPANLLARVLDSGTHPSIGEMAEPRSMLSDAGWSRLRATCPAETRDTSLDLKVAEAVLRDPALYGRALSAMPDTVAHLGHAPISALH